MLRCGEVVRCFYAAPQAPVVEHDDQLTGLDLWGEGGPALGASVGADLRWGRRVAGVREV